MADVKLVILACYLPYIIHTPNPTFHRFRSEQYFGSPSDTAAAVEGVRERLLLVEERRLQLQEARLHNDDEEEVLKGQEARLDVIGEELSEKEEQDEEEEEEVGQQDEESERATQDC